MPYTPLFEYDRIELLHDVHGRIVYFSDRLPRQLASEWFELLRTGSYWRRGRCVVNGREVAVERLTADFALTTPDAPLPIQAAADLVSTLTGANFNAARLHYYRDGRDCVPPHADRLRDLMPGSPIAIVSLGATRRATIVPKHDPYCSVEIDIASGSIVYMDYVSQFHFLHGIARADTNTGERISLSFRRRCEYF